METAEGQERRRIFDEQVGVDAVVTSVERNPDAAVVCPGPRFESGRSGDADV